MSIDGHPRQADRSFIFSGDRSTPVTHLAVSGDNLEALTLLETSGDLLPGQADVVYLDPPYNTGNVAFDRYRDKYAADFAIDDDPTAGQDWVDFMRPRLQAAHRLLNRLGVLMVSIGDDEHHRLRVLLDEIFGPKNFVSNVVWVGGSHGDARFVSNSVDYIVIYARDFARMKAAGIKWREPKPLAAEILTRAAEFWASSEQHPHLATAALKAWQTSLPKDHPYRAPAAADYNKIDEHGDVYRFGSLAKVQQGHYLYDLIDPATGQAANRHPNGWRMPEARAAQMLADGDIIFSADGKQARSKLRLRDLAAQVPRNLIDSPRARGDLHLKNVLGGDFFPFPKDHEVLAKWIGYHCPPDGIVVDFFAGSGSTAEAVIRLNAGQVAGNEPGKRRCVAITNNEVAQSDRTELAAQGFEPGDPEWERHGVFDRVLVPRLTTVLTGIRPDGSTYDDPVAGRVEIRVLDTVNVA